MTDEIEGTLEATTEATVAEIAAAFPAAPELEAAVRRGEILNATAITKRFGGLVAVHDVDFAIPEGAIVSLIGPNGAGKTTFFNIIAGIYDPTSGRIAFHGRNMVSRARRAWLEPVLWVIPAAIIAVITFAIGSSGGVDAGVTAIGIVLTVLALMTNMVIGVSRPPWYIRLITRLGIFKSARPNDMVVAGLGRTFQNIRLFQNMTALENVLVGMHCRMRATLDRRSAVDAAEAARGGRLAREGRRAPEARRAEGSRSLRRQEPAVRGSAPARDRPGAGLQPNAAPPRRADRRHEPARDLRPDEADQSAARESSD